MIHPGNLSALEGARQIGFVLRYGKGEYEGFLELPVRQTTDAALAFSTDLFGDEV